MEKKNEGNDIPDDITESLDELAQLDGADSSDAALKAAASTDAGTGPSDSDSAGQKQPEHNGPAAGNASPASTDGSSGGNS